MSQGDLISILLSIKLAIGVVTLLLFAATPLAWYLSQKKTKIRTTIELILTLPMVLPPTVLGFYLLIAFSNQWGLGSIGIHLAFSFWGILIGVFIHTLPFYLQPLTSHFKSIPKEQIEHSYYLGMGKYKRYFTLVLPMSKKIIFSLLFVGAAHSLGEFGVVLMIGGNLGGETKVASVSIFEKVQQLEYVSANKMALIMLLLSASMLLLAKKLQNNKGD